MAYHTVTDLEDALGGAAELTWVADPTNTSPRAAAVTTLINAAIEASENRIDAVAVGKPGTTGTKGAMWTDTLALALAKQTAISLTLYTIYERRRREEIPEGVKDAYTQALADLESLRKGEWTWVSTETSAQDNTATVYYYSGTCADSARSTNPRRTQRFQLDKL